MKIIFNSEALKNAVKKIGKFTTKGCILTCTNVMASVQEGSYMARLSACNGVSEITVGIAFHSDEPIDGTFILNLSPKFGMGAEALAEFGKEIALCVDGKTARLECGVGTIPVDLMESCMKLSAAKMDGDPVEFSVGKDAFAAAMTQGGAASGNCPVSVMNETIWLSPAIDEDGNPYIHIISGNSVMATGARMPVQCKAMDKFQKWVCDRKGIVLKYAGLLTAAGRLEESARIFILKDRLVLSADEMDLYSFVAVEGIFPAKILDLLAIPEEKSFTACLKKSDFKKAASVVMLSTEDKRQAVVKVTLKESQLILEDKKETTRISLQAIGNGEGVIYLDMKRLLKLCESAMGDDITIYGANINMGSAKDVPLCAYITGSDTNASSFLLPIRP